MKKDEAVRLLKETFKNEFDEERYIRFVKEVFNTIVISPADKTRFVAKQYKQYISHIQKIGEYRDKDNKMEVLAVKLHRTSSRDRARTMQRNFIANWLSKTGMDAALVAFYGDEKEDWRLSFVKMEYSLDEDGGIKKELTPAKRYSFLVGVNEPNHTCAKQFLDIVMNDRENPLVSDIEAVFSIDNVTKEFFEEYKRLFLSLKESLDRIIAGDENVRAEFEEKGISSVDFSKKLLGQIVFLYFLQKKGWMGVAAGEEWGSGPKNFLRKLYDGEYGKYDNFFNDMLEPLFYEALASDRSADNDYYRLFKCRIPFLNGGLFEPLNEYNWTGTNITLDNEIFEHILETFDRFNFTVKEDEPLEKEVAVDPEMLGKVFENLLEVKDRKSRGAFYTPREIVHYMCQQSLINYLETNTGIEREDIERFIIRGDAILDKVIRVEEYKSQDVAKEEMLPASIKDNYGRVDELLREIKIVDPAVGSGAFPVGMLNEIVKARSILTVLFDEREGRNTYALKRETIENSLYGVDIDSSAVEIAKLRFWLSLIVDEEDMKNIKPLPNLDHKIMCGNSLLEEFEGVKLFDEGLLGDAGAKSPAEAEIAGIEAEIQGLQRELDAIPFGQGGAEISEKADRLEELKKRKKRLEKSAKAGKENSQITIDEAARRRIRESQRKLKEYRKLQKDYFNEQDRNRKKELREKMDRIEWELIEATLKEQGNEEAMTKLKRYRKTKSKPFFLWKLYFFDVFQRENPGFDVVIANPPYGIVYDDYLKGIYERLFSSFKRNNDIYISFFEHGYRILRNNGQLTYITPNTYLNGDYFKKWRKTLTTLARIRELIDYKSFQVFEDPTVFVSVIVTSKGPNFPYIFPLKTPTKSLTTFNIEQVVVKEPAETKLKPKNALLQKILEREDIELVDKLFYVKDVGFNYWTKGRGKTRGGDSIGNRLFYRGKKASESDIPFIKGRDIAKWYIAPPNNYLRHNFSELLDPSVDTFRFSEDFLRINPKIIYRQTSNRIISTLDTNSYLVDKTVHIIVPKDNHHISLIYLLSLLNSKLFDYLYHFISQENAGRAFAQVKTTYIKQLPIPKIPPDQQAPFISLVDQILSITKDDDYLANPEKQARVKELEKEIDRLVYELYGLTDEEIEVVERFEKGV